MLLGAHIGIAGDWPGGKKGPKRTIADAPEVGASLGCDVIQIFSKNQMQWKSSPLSKDLVEKFRKNHATHLKGPGLIHTSYLLNLASMDDELFAKSVDGLVVEVERAEQLGIPWVVFHPGSPKEKGREWGCARVADGVKQVLDRTKGMKAGVLLETNAGAGNSVGRTFEELHAMLEGIDGAGHARRAGVCADTCHVFVSGYDIADAKGYETTWDGFDRIVGLDRLKCLHLNDSKGPLGSNKDRHDSIGKGLLGVDFWKRLVNDKRFETLPGYCETPLGEDGYAADIQTLRGFEK